MKKVIVYSRDYCSYCEMAKRLLNSRQIPYEEIDLTHDHDLREKLAGPHHWKTLPMIFIGEDFVGGFRELSELDRQGTLAERVQ